MKTLNLKLALLTLLVLFSATGESYAQDTNLEQLKFERIIDGDSFYASGKEIHIWGIDAPEEGHIIYFTATLFLETMLTDGSLECQSQGDGFYQCFVNGKEK